MAFKLDVALVVIAYSENVSQLDFDLCREFIEDDVKLLVVYSDPLNPLTWMGRQSNSELTISLVERFALVEYFPINCTEYFRVIPVMHVLEGVFVRFLQFVEVVNVLFFEFRGIEVGHGCCLFLC